MKSIFPSFSELANDSRAPLIQEINMEGGLTFKFFLSISFILYRCYGVASLIHCGLLRQLRKRFGINLFTPNIQTKISWTLEASSNVKLT